MTTRKTLAIGLLASLALNLFLAGVLTRSWSKGAHCGEAHGPQHSPPEHRRNAGDPPGDRRRAEKDRGPPDLELLRQMIRIMGREDPRVQQVLSESRQHMRRKRVDLSQARSQVLSALTANPYRPEALQSALADLKAQSQELQGQAQTHVVELAGKLTAEERHRLRSAPPSPHPRLPH